MDSSAADNADRLIDIAAGVKASKSAVEERRSRDRVPYDATVALILLGPDGYRSDPMLLRAKDISVGGISVISRNMIHVGAAGAIQLVKSDGRAALVGVEVRHCRYTGRMTHETGMRFTPIPEGLAPCDFLDRQGRMKILIPDEGKGR
ncbi:MAG: PilZ domain-containing protein [Phycisphaerales bacterium]|nr:MAG: PilZ domain-containing protein [Phycisphaerales bacterium]